MIYNKVGETLEFEGKKYAVGENIVGAETSEYEGLFGYIKEIRTDNDKDTENEPPPTFTVNFSRRSIPMKSKKWKNVFPLFTEKGKH